MDRVGTYSATKGVTQVVTAQPRTPITQENGRWVASCARSLFRLQLSLRFQCQNHECVRGYSTPASTVEATSKASNLVLVGIMYAAAMKGRMVFQRRLCCCVVLYPKVRQLFSKKNTAIELPRSTPPCCSTIDSTPNADSLT